MMVKRNHDDEFPTAEEIAAALKKTEDSGFSVRGWAQLNNMVYVAVMLVGCIGWGLKMEFRIDDNLQSVRALENRVNEGILPIAAIEIKTLKEKVTALQDEITYLRTQQDTVHKQPSRK